jgi:DNA-binding GntR family transcriptional regulator
MDDKVQDGLEADHSLAGQIARALAAKIVSGSLRPGERLLQDQVAQDHRASHVPVREAFQRLEAQGLVVIEPRRGVRVARLDPSDVLEVAEMRATLETLALRHAMPRMTQPDIQRAAEALDASAGRVELAALEGANRRFHQAITTPCGMPRLLATIADLHCASERHLYATWASLGWQTQSDAEHRSILVAIEKGQAQVACRLLAKHILDAGRALAAALAG